MSSSRDPARGLARLGSWIGTWRGTGHGSFPGIEPFDYAERLVFRTRDGETSLHFEQEAWLVDDGRIVEPSHWETGFLEVTTDERVVLLNAQASGRVEVLRGDVTEGPGGGVELSLASVVHAHDPRVVATRRHFRLAGDELTYRMEMATTRIPDALVHLEARLWRS